MSRPRSSRLRITQAPTGLNLSSTLASSKLAGTPARKVLGGSDSTLGNKNRTVPRVNRPMPAVKVTQAGPVQVTLAMKPRRVGPPLAGGLAAAGLGGTGGAAGFAAGGVAGAGGVGSAMGPSSPQAGNG